MKPTVSKRSVMKRAWMLYKHYTRVYKTFAAALREAWVQEKRIAIRKYEESAQPVREERASMDDFMAGAAAWYRNGRPGQYFGD